MEYIKQLDVIGEYDIVIAGGGPGGIGAAISAADMGMKVLIIERAGVVGGNITIGHVSPLMGRYIPNTMADYIIRYLSDDNKPDCNAEEAKIRLTALLDEKGIDVYLNTSLCDVIRADNKIKSIVISTQSGLKAVNGKVFIDGTGDGVLSSLAGEKTEYGREDGLVQPMSIMFTIGGIAPDQKLTCYHEEDETPLKKGGYLQMCRDACKKGELPPEVNIIRLYPGQNSDERVVNATQTNGYNPLELSEYNKAQVALRRQMKMVVDFLKNNVEGFENVFIKDSSDIVGVRESRRVIGQYVLDADSLIDGRPFEDVIVHKADFPIDIHNPAGAGQAESETLPVSTQKYDIPYRCIVPLVNENLFLSGRCISGTHRAHASYRVMNIVLNVAEAAGIAAALCIKNGETNKTLGYKEVQKVLNEKGIELF